MAAPTAQGKKPFAVVLTQAQLEFQGLECPCCGISTAACLA